MGGGMKAAGLAGVLVASFAIGIGSAALAAKVAKQDGESAANTASAGANGAVAGGSDATPESAQAVDDSPGLLVNVDYPKTSACGETDFGLPPSAPKPEAWTVDNYAALQSEAVAAGARPIGNGSAVLRLTMPPSMVAYIVDIKPVVFERGHPLPAWRWVDVNECGGPVVERNFFVNLDRPDPQMVDLGTSRLASGDAEVPTQSLGPEFTVSEVKPVRVKVTGMSCTGSVSWGLEIDYIQEGKKRTATIAAPDDPFVIYSSDVPAFTSKRDSSRQKLGTLTSAPSTPNSCRDLSARTS